MPLTVKQIEAARHGVQKERLGDGSGLYLRLYPSGRKAFQVLVGKSGQARGRVWISLGEYPEMTLKAARGRAAEVRNWAADGAGPDEIRARLSGQSTSRRKTGKQTRRQTKASTPAPAATTFRAVAETWFERKRIGLKNGKHIAQNWSTLETYVFPSLADRPIGEIDVREVVEVFRPIWHAKNETAQRTLGRVQEVFELAKLEHGLNANPADFAVHVAYGRVRRQTKHFGALAPQRMPEFWTWLQTVPCEEDTRQLVSLMVLTAKRTRETRFAEWRFFDEDLTVWTTPGWLMKMGREHQVPISRQARVVLRNIEALNGDRTHLFDKPRNRSGVICENAARLLVKRFDETITGHGFRASFNTWATEWMDYDHQAVELSLAHARGKLDEAYQRAHLLPKRAPIMQDWADFVTSGEDPRSFTE